MKTVTISFFAAAVLLLSSCVTETVGGTDYEEDPQAALERSVELARQYIRRGVRGRRHQDAVLHDRGLLTACS